MSDKTQSMIAFACGVLGVVAAVWVYWLILPGVILGAVAVVLGWRTHRKEGSEHGERRDGPRHRRHLSRALGPGRCRQCGRRAGVGTAHWIRRTIRIADRRPRRRVPAPRSAVMRYLTTRRYPHRSAPRSRRSRMGQRRDIRRRLRIPPADVRCSDGRRRGTATDRAGPWWDSTAPLLRTGAEPSDLWRRVGVFPGGLGGGRVPVPWLASACGRASPRFDPAELRSRLDADGLAAVAVTAEEEGFDSGWVTDHLHGSRGGAGVRHDRGGACIARLPGR